MPQWGRLTGKKRKVRAGGDITGYEAGVLFALKGNRTLEFWCWKDWPEAYGARPDRDGVTASAYDIRRSSFAVSPNPLRSGILHLTTGPLDHWTTVSVFDALGRRVLARTLESSTPGPLSFDLRSLPTGTYLVRLEAGSKAATRKLVIER
jgi:hypothetical protein